MANKKAIEMGEPDARLELVSVTIKMPPELWQALDAWGQARSIGSRSVAARAALADAVGVELPVEIRTGVRARKYASARDREKAQRRRFTTRAGRVSEILQAVAGGPVTVEQRAAVVAGLARCGQCGSPLLTMVSENVVAIASCPNGCDRRTVCTMEG
jgi:predicted transcriptional regulator/bacterioferritin-associated ferredoxin